MINTTNKLEFFKKLPAEVAEETLFSVSQESRSWQNYQNVKRIRKASLWFAEFFRRENQISAPDERFVQAAFDFSCLTSRNKNASRFTKIIGEYFSGVLPAADALSFLKRGFKLFLLHLWDHGYIGLPTTFSCGANFPMPKLQNPLLQFCSRFNPDGPAAHTTNSELARRIYYYVPRVLFASNWTTVGSLSIDEYAQLHEYVGIARTRGTAVATSSPIPWTGFLTELLSALPESVSFSEVDLREYRNWMASHPLDVDSRGAPLSFQGFRAQHLVKTHAKPKKKAGTSSSRPSQQALRHIANGAPLPASASEAEKAEEVRDAQHAAALMYIRKLRGQARVGQAFDWRKGHPIYPGREHIDTAKLGSKWLAHIGDYFHHRQIHEKTEAHEEASYACNHLVDYLLLYLPWYFEIYPESSATFPLSAASFTRFPFVQQGQIESRKQFPISLFEFVEGVRTTSGSVASARRSISGVFDYLAKYRSDDESVGPDFTNPILKDDIPRGGHPTKTNKPVFPRSAVPFLTGFAKACETFGEYLSEASYDGRIPDFGMLQKTGPHDQYDCSACGYVPLVFKDSRFHPVLEIPDVFLLAERVHEYTVNNRLYKETRTVVHCTTLRICICGIENGLRFQSIQWLDINEWDSLNKVYPPTTEFTYFPKTSVSFPLYVSVDKRKEEAWDTTIFFTIRATLAREEKFQRERAVDGLLTPVLYEDRESRFGTITPLFRSDRSSKPVSDNTYAKVWVKLMTGFQHFYPSMLGHSNYSFIHFSKPALGELGKIVYVDDVAHGPLPACELRYRAICTPHSCRSSFATNNRHLMSPEEIALFCGQSAARIARYYMNPSKEELAETYVRAHQELYAGMYFVDADAVGARKIVAAEAVTVRADKSDSALRRAMTKDRTKAIEEFGFIAPLVFWSLDEGSKLGVTGPQLLRYGPMHEFHFFDTHICPVNKECPSEVVAVVGEKGRCGLCPLAMKCVDHLPAIAAKIRHLASRILYLNSLRTAMQKSGEPSEGYARITDDCSQDMAEFDGWFRSQEMLSTERERLLVENESRKFYSVQPNLLNPHLRIVEKILDDGELSAQRIFDSAAYPSMSDPEVQLRASIIRRKLMKGVSIEDLGLPAAAPDVVIAAHALRLRLSMSPHEHIRVARDVLSDVLGERA